MGLAMAPKMAVRRVSRDSGRLVASCFQDVEMRRKAAVRRVPQWLTVRPYATCVAWHESRQIGHMVKSRLVPLRTGSLRCKPTIATPFLCVIQKSKATSGQRRTTSSL